MSEPVKAKTCRIAIPASAYRVVRQQSSTGTGICGTAISSPVSPPSRPIRQAAAVAASSPLCRRPPGPATSRHASRTAYTARQSALLTPARPVPALGTAPRAPGSRSPSSGRMHPCPCEGTARERQAGCSTRCTGRGASTGDGVFFGSAGRQRGHAGGCVGIVGGDGGCVWMPVSGMRHAHRMCRARLCACRVLVGACVRLPIVRSGDALPTSVARAHIVRHVFFLVTRAAR